MLKNIPSASRIDHQPFEQSQEFIANQNTLNNCSINVTQVQNNSKLKRIDGLNYNVPGYPEHEIVGRKEDADKVLNLLKNSSDPSRRNRVVVTGIGGIGKTTLAILCARQWQLASNTSVPNIAFLHAESTRTFNMSVQGLATLLNIDKSLSTAEIFKIVAELYKESSLLVILDNLEHLNVVKCVLDLSSKIYVLGTSQNRGFGKHFIEYHLQFLLENESERLITSIFGESYSVLPKTSDLNVLLEILITKFDGLPLSLAHAASYIKHEIDDLCFFNKLSRNSELYIKSIKKYLNSFDKELQKSFPDQFITTDSKSTYTAIKINLEKLADLRDASALPSVSVQILLIICDLKPEKIKKDIFLVLFDEYDFELALTNLKKYCIIYHTIDDDSIYLNVHKITKNITKIMFGNIFITCQNKIALYSLFVNQIDIFNDQALLSINLETFDIKGNEIVKIIERAFSIFEKNVNNSMKILENAGYNTRSLIWPLPHKLLLASCVGFNCKLIIFVLQNIGDLQAIDANNFTILHLVVTKCLRNDIIKFLIKSGLLSDAKTIDFITPLHIAIAFVSKYSYYLRKEYQNYKKGISNFDSSTLKILIDNSNVNNQNHHGDTVLHIIARQWFYFNDNLTIIMKYLVDAGVNFEIKNKHGNAPIHTAVQNYNRIVIDLFHRLGANINIQNFDGNTALHIAVREAVLNRNATNMIINEIILLLNLITCCGARTDIFNNLNETVVDYAKKNEQKYLSDWLQKTSKGQSILSSGFPLDLAWDAIKKLFIDHKVELRYKVK